MSLARDGADRPLWARPRCGSVDSSGAEGMLEQAACDELLGRLHHVLPHLKRSPLLIEKCESLLPTHRIALLVTHSYQMRKCDFSDHPFSVFLICHCLDPHWFTALQAPLKPPSEFAHWTHGINLLAIIRLRNPQSANLVLQGGTLQSETLGGSPFACDPSRCGSQCADDYRGLCLSKRRTRSHSNSDLG